MSIIYVIMVIATMQSSDPINSNYQRVKFNSKVECEIYLKNNRMYLTHELIHALENLENDKLLDMQFGCVKDKGTEI